MEGQRDGVRVDEVNHAEVLLQQVVIHQALVPEVLILLLLLLVDVVRVGVQIYVSLGRGNPATRTLSNLLLPEWLVGKTASECLVCACAFLFVCLLLSLRLRRAERLLTSPGQTWPCQPVCCLPWLA